MALSSVDFPAPFGPKIDMKSPGRISRLMFFTAVTGPNFLVRLTSLTRGAGGAEAGGILFSVVRFVELLQNLGGAAFKVDSQLVVILKRELSHPVVHLDVL